MNTILEQYADKINGSFSFFDQMIIKGHIFQFFSTSGKKHFLSFNNILLKDFPTYANHVTNSIVSKVETYTSDLNRPMVYLPSNKESKEGRALQILHENPVSQGLICTLSAVEYCSTLQPKKNEQGLLYLAHVNRKCKYYYFYFLDKEFGYMHVKLQTWRIKHRMKSNSIKMYDKFSCLRIEMTINDPKEFKVYKKVHHRDGATDMRWSPMGKSISNLYRYAEVSQSANMRYLSSLQGILPKKSIDAEISEICAGKTVAGKRYTGFNVWEKDTFELFTELSNASYIIRGFTNKDILRAIYPKCTPNSKANRNQITRLFSKLRAHALIKKVPHSHRYFLTEKGRRIMGALIETRNRTYPELAS